MAKAPAQIQDCGIYTHKLMLAHNTGAQHPEQPKRLAALHQLFESAHYTALLQPAPNKALEADIARVHPYSHINSLIDRLPDSGAVLLDNGDTVLSPDSYDAALQAVGCGLQALSDIASGKLRRAFCAVRPPGHHAEQHLAMGFCLFNTVAVLAAAAQDKYNLKRVAMIDFDIHHGNGTQDFVLSQKNRDGLFYASTHQSPFFPFTGLTAENIEGRLLNIPLPARTNGAQLLAEYNDAVRDALVAFKPDILLISAGFDAHRDDPLGDFRLDTEDFGLLGAWSREMADSLCDGRVLAVLEGGYNLQALPASVDAYCRALFGLEI